MKVCIIYGWAEGPWQGKRLRATLQQAGYSVTRNPKEADVIIAHSGGCYMLPAESRAKLFMLIGVPYWPGKTILRGLHEKVRKELKDVWWFKKTFFNSYYLLSRPKRWLRMWYRWRKQQLPSFETIPFLLVRNTDDSFMHPTDIKDLMKTKNWDLQAVAGHHDDVWRNPEAYVQLIKSSIS